MMVRIFDHCNFEALEEAQNGLFDCIAFWRSGGVHMLQIWVILWYIIV